MNALRYWLAASKLRKTLIWSTVTALSIVIAASWYLGTHTDLFFAWQRRNTTADLREVPIGQVRVRGVVTYVDGLNKRFWLQDETGAIVVNQDPRVTDTQYGDLVQVAMRKNHAFDSALGFASLGLADFKVERKRRNAALPKPSIAIIATLGGEAKTGIRVTTEGVLHAAYPKAERIVQLAIGDDGQEVEAIVPGEAQHIEKWLNARVRITGVLEVRQDEGWMPTSRIIWAQSEKDLERIPGPPEEAETSNARSIYAEQKHLGAHMVRIRGKVLYQEQQGTLFVEDAYGVIGCTLEQPQTVATGTSVEVRGFLKKDGLRIDLVHATASQVQGENMPPPEEHPVMSIAGVRALAENVIRTAPPVRVTGVITYIEPDLRQLFLQDSTAGIFLKYSGTPISLYPGEKVSVVGMAHEGDFAPVIVAPKFIPMGKAPIPKPAPMNLRAPFGALDCLYGEVEGVVHPSNEKQLAKHAMFYLHSALGPIHVDLLKQGTDSNFMAGLQDATVRARGVVGEIFNARKQLIGLQLTIPNASEIKVIEPGDSDPFAGTATPISDLLKFSPQSRPDHRVTVSGTVTMLGNGFFYLQDRSGGVRIESDTSGLHVNDAVDSAGYAVPTGYSPVLTDAVFRVHHEASPISPQPVTADMMSDGEFDSQLVTVDARLLSVENTAGVRTLSVTSGGHTFSAVLYLKDTGQPFVPPQEGSLLRLTSICSVEVNQKGTGNLLKKEPVAFKLIIRSPADIQVLGAGSWWTLGRSLTVVGILILIVLISAGRIVVLLRRIDGKNEELRKASEKESAIRQLINAMQQVRIQKQFTSQVSLPAADELAMLGAEFNHMVEELRIRDVAKAEAEAKLQRQALSDALTGLPNRRLLSDRLTQNIEAAKRSGNMLAVLYIDLDGFKLVNDSFGHNFGDVLLNRVAKRISSRIRKSDTLSRLGGDEFAVVVNNLKAKEAARALAQTLLDEIARPFEINGQEITIGASIGICIYPDHASDESELLQFADSAMYAAKRAGKNRAVLFTADLGESIRERLTIENQLRRAIDDCEIAIHYQPEFEIHTGRLIRFEALARWTHTTLGSIPPSKFIPIAEESGLIIRLGAYVMERACRDCVLWQSDADAPVEVAVNVSNVQFAQDTFVDEVQALLHKTGMPAHLLQLELTESVMIIGLEDAVEKIKALQNIGVTVAIDDFGTGYSALSYMPKLPFNALKIDRTFMREIMQRPEAKSMVHSLVVLAHELGMKVIVEGIENEAQLAIIKEIGANAVQGFLLGRPTPEPSQLLSQRSENPERGHSNIEMNAVADWA